MDQNYQGNLPRQEKLETRSTSNGPELRRNQQKREKEDKNKALFINNKTTRRMPEKETVDTQSGVERGHFVDGEIPMHKIYALILPHGTKIWKV